MSDQLELVPCPMCERWALLLASAAVCERCDRELRDAVDRYRPKRHRRASK